MLNYFKNLFKSNSKAINNPPNNSNNHTINENTDYPGPCAAFLSGEENCCGTIIRFTEFSDDQLENSHSWIQYVFPLQEPSEYNPIIVFSAFILVFEVLTGIGMYVGNIDSDTKKMDIYSHAFINYIFCYSINI